MTNFGLNNITMNQNCSECQFPILHDAVFPGTRWLYLGAVTEQQFYGISTMALLWGEAVWSLQRNHHNPFFNKHKDKHDFGTSPLWGEVIWSSQRHHRNAFVDTKTNTSTTLGPQHWHLSEVRLCEVYKDTKTKTRTNTSTTTGPRQQHGSEVRLFEVYKDIFIIHLLTQRQRHVRLWDQNSGLALRWSPILMAENDWIVVWIWQRCWYKDKDWEREKDKDKDKNYFGTSTTTPFRWGEVSIW